MTTVINNPAAQEQAAMHRTELLLARCRNCIPSRTPWDCSQTRWHAQHQANFLAWLDAGGFAQAAPEQHDPQQAEPALRDGGPAPARPSMSSPQRCAQ